MRFSRRTFLLSAVGGVTALPGYARFLEPGWLEVTHKRVPLGLAGDIRILHLSDFHASESVPFSLIEEAVELGLAERPELAFLTGDFITRRLDGRGEYKRILRRLADALPTFASLGNHDGGRWVARHGGHTDTSLLETLFDKAGVVLLRNDARLLQADGQTLHVVELGDLWARQVDADAAFGAVEAPPGVPILVLAHNPDTRLGLRDRRWDLMLSGHTHGGQIVIPVVGYKPFVSVGDERFLEGLQPWEGRLVHITRGVGNLLGWRLNCRPEVSLLTLSPG